MAKTRTKTVLARSDYDANGIVDENTETTRVTDRKGNEISVSERYDYDGDGVWQNSYTTTREFDKKGNAVRQFTQHDGGADGTVETEVDVVRTFNRNGQVLSETSTADEDLSTPEPNSIRSETHAYDKRGNLVDSIITEDWNADGVPDNASRETWTYKKGDLVQTTWDYGNDGALDHVTNYLIDRPNRNTKIVRAETDGFADGSVDTVTETTTVTDRRGNEISFTERYDHDLNGAWDGWIERTKEFDKKGNVTHESYRTDWEGDGQVEWTEDYSRVFDREGQVVLETYKGDADPSTPGWGFIYTTTNEYDKRGNLTESCIKLDDLADGTIDTQARYTWTFDRGDLVRFTGDYNDDGVIDTVTDYLIS